MRTQLLLLPDCIRAACSRCSFHSAYVVGGAEIAAPRRCSVVSLVSDLGSCCSDCCSALAGVDIGLGVKAGSAVGGRGIGAVAALG